MLSIRHDVLPPNAAFSQTGYAATFARGRGKAIRLYGPCTLIRLVDSSRYSVMNTSPGDFWMEERVFRDFLQKARADVLRSGTSTAAHLVGLHMRFQLRDGFAVCRDWSNLDKFIRLDLPAGGSIIALAGATAPQAYYSIDRPEDQSRAAAAGVHLPGNSVQIVIDFNFPPNVPAKQWVRGPFSF